MKVAIISDLHGNIYGVIEVLRAIDRIGGVDKLVVAGDVLTASSGTNDLMDLLVARDAEFVKGNIEEIIDDLEGSIPNIPPRFHVYAKTWEHWIRQRLSSEYLKLLSESPLQRIYHLGEGHTILICHATRKNTWERVCAPGNAPERLKAEYGSYDADVIAYGHFHMNHIIPLGDKLLVNVASVGMRTDSLSSFTIVDSVSGNIVIRQYAVPYDSEAEKRLNREMAAPVFEELVKDG
jgi:predicted phosphodiesterase